LIDDAILSSRNIQNVLYTEYGTCGSQEYVVVGLACELEDFLR
jgi:hypothetical protein